MFEKYRTFDATNFVKDYYKYKAMLPEMQDRYDSLDGLSAISVKEDRVQQSPSPDGLEKIALSRVSITERIEAYKQHIKTAELAFSLLDPDEFNAIDYFFALAPTCDSTPYSRAQLYRLKAQALEKIARLVDGAYKYY